VLTEKRDKLETVTQRLLVVEVMEGDELRQLLAVVPPPSPDDVPLPATD
jgi:ATP-dependent Zn protease